MDGRRDGEYWSVLQKQLKHLDQSWKDEKAKCENFVFGRVHIYLFIDRGCGVRCPGIKGREQTGRLAQRYLC